MKLFDSHAHLDFPQYNGFRKDIIKEAFDNDVVGIVNIGIDLDSSKKSIELSQKYDNIWATVGFHPHDASKLNKPEMMELEKLCLTDKVVAVGEIGLDFYRNLSPRDEQYKAFEKQISLARKYKLPMVVHIREAYDEALSVLRDNGADEIGGVLHCFAGNEKHIDEAKKLGFVFSFNGTLTYKNSKAVAMAEYAGIENILIETDCPYLTPVPFRGKLNKPSYVHYVAEKLSEIFAPLTPEEVSIITDMNTRKLFNLPLESSGRTSYVIANTLYLNITNQCSNSCFFCSRSSDYTIGDYNLELAYEPSAEEIIESAGDVSRFDEVVFCGYGEPTYSLDTLLKVARNLKGRGAHLRLNTNGQGSLINDRDIIPDLAKYFDSFSISLNASTKERYNQICKPDNPEKAFDGVIDFTRKSVGVIPEVVLSVVNVPKVEIDQCQAIADDIGVSLRIREYNKKT
ncbi:MAG: YchF/TatD family DNA exonuclease [candidate division Zixibacteria bacterium]|nr:YchF/TatD family DNA exonuclease [candidate division Zixibacteria bacterium]